jgi:hypothetical protein
MNTDQAIALTEARIGPREITNIEGEEVEAWLNSARQRFAREKLEEGSKDYQRTDPLTLGLDGSVALPADAFEESVSRVTHASDTLPFVMMETREAFDYDGSGEYSLCAVENRKIYTKPKRGVDAPLSGDIMATIIFIPTLGTLLAKDEGRFVDHCAELAQERWKFNPVGKDSKRPVSRES